MRSGERATRAVVLAGLGMMALAIGLHAAQTRTAAAPLPPFGTTKGQQYSRLVIRNATVVSGRGTPAQGPVDIVIEKDRIVDMVPMDGVSVSGYGPGFKRPTGDRVIDATGMYVLPGLVDAHAHIPGNNQRGTGPRGMEYGFRLWLGNGITTVRDPGASAGLDTLVEQRRLSEANQVVAPRILIYKFWPSTARQSGHGHNADEAHALVRQYKAQGADGIKLLSEPSHYPDVFRAICDEAKALGMGTATDLKVGETDAVIASNAGVTSIEHWYGIPDAAIPGSQHFPADYNYLNELQRFREAGRIWAEASKSPERLSAVIDLMIKNNTVWEPTFVVYEANRDLSRVLTLPWRAPYTTSGVLDYWAPNPAHHASFHSEWTTTDEVNWTEDFQIWMHWVHEFFVRGGRLTVGSDAGTQQALYGFSTIRELELMQQAGINPIDVVQIATTNATDMLGLKAKGVDGIRIGNIADLIVVDGNPLQNFKVLYGMGYDHFTPEGKAEHRGGVKWTIKAGVVFDAPALLREVQWYVQQEANAASRTTEQ